MYPHLTLKIENQNPQIIFHPDSEVSRKLTQNNEDIVGEIIKIATKLDLTTEGLSKEAQVDQILQLASVGDNELIEALPTIDTVSLEFNLNETLNSILEDLQGIEQDYSNIEMSEEVRAELERNRRIDILASLIDQLYDILIAKTLLAAYELEITDIHLSSDYNYARLTERMGNEIQKLGLEFTIDS